MTETPQVYNHSHDTKDVLLTPSTLRPLSEVELEKIKQNQLEQATKNPALIYGTRHSFMHLTQRNNIWTNVEDPLFYNLYALPEVNGLNPLELLQKLPADAVVLDVACGEGAFVQIYGLDANRFEGDGSTKTKNHLPNKDYSGFYQDRIDKISSDDLDHNIHVSKFDLIVLSAIYHHLVDPYSVIRQYAQYLTDKNGIMTVTMLPRVVDYDEPYEIEEYGIKRQKRDFRVNDNSQGLWPDSMYGSTNCNHQTIVTVEGAVIQPLEFYNMLSDQNPGYDITFSLVDTNNIDSQDLAGRLVINRHTDKPFVIEGLFHAYDANRNTNLYIFARGQQEKEQLKAKGYLQV